MADLYEATSHGAFGFSRRVAIKRLLRESLDDPELVAGFLDEARILSQLSHGNIVSLLDFGELDGAPFQALELIDGVDLSTLEDQRAERRELLPETAALFIVSELARALEHAHSAKDGDGRSLGVVHRDVSPENVLVSFAGDVKLADFGIALAHARQARTKVGISKGKLEWMAPEQHRGEVADPRADIFALGLVLVRVLSGENPMASESLRRKVIAGQPVELPSGLPPDLITPISRALVAQREGRTKSALELRRALLAAIASRDDLDPRDTLVEVMAGLRQGGRPKARSPLSALFAVPEENADVPDAVAVPSLLSSESAGSSEPTKARADSVTAPDPQRAQPRDAKPEESETTAPEEDETAIRFGEYRIQASIGRGGFGEVFKAVREDSGETYALKILHTPATHRRAHERFRREIDALTKLSHQGLVKVIDRGSTPDGRLYMVMELLRGKTVRGIVEDRGPLPLDEVAPIIRSVLATLEEVHAAGYVHRDLSPANVMKLDDGRVKVLDFGVALPTESESTRLTRAGDVVGTLRFLSPEQLQNPEIVGAPTDIYSVGLLAIYMLDGAGPFTGPARQVAERRLSGAPVVSERAGPLGPLITAMLCREVRDRPTASEALASVELLAGVGAATRVIAAPRGRLARLIAALTVCLASIAIVLLGAKLLGQRAPVELAAEPAPSVEASAAPRLEVASEVDREASAVFSPTATVAQESTKPWARVKSKSLPVGLRRGSSAERRPAKALAADAVRTTVSAELRSRGLELSDLLLVPSTAEVGRRLRDAVAARDEVAARRALAELDLGSFEGERFLEERLKGVLARIRASSAKVEPSELARFERRFLDVRTRVGPGIDASDVRDALASLRALEAEIAAASE